MNPLSSMFTNQLHTSHQKVSDSPKAASRIIPIQIERGPHGAFMGQQSQLQRPDSIERSVPINNLNELKMHQEASKAEENIRGFTKPKVS